MAVMQAANTDVAATLLQAAAQSAPAALAPAPPPGISGQESTPVERQLFIGTAGSGSQQGRDVEAAQSQLDLNTLMATVKQLATTVAEMKEAINKQTQPKETRTPLLQAAADGAFVEPVLPKPVAPPGNDDDDDDDLAGIHFKDVGRPAKYNGKPEQWRNWNLKFKGFLVRRDQRWGDP